jgi:hypothetical protein
MVAPQCMSCIIVEPAITPFSLLTLNKYNYNIISRLEKVKHHTKTSHIQGYSIHLINIYVAKVDF